MQGYKHVVILGVDGAGAFFNRTDTPNIDRIFEGESVTYDMRVTAPTSSCPSWMTCLHGVNPEHHGLIENFEVEEYVHNAADFKFPSFLKVVKDKYPESEVAALYQWIGINGIVEDDVGITKLKLYDSVLAEYICNDYLVNKTPTVLYVHFGSPDSMGHGHGYGSKEHLNQITLVDGYIGMVYDKLVERGMMDDTLLIVTSDHGGEGKWHGGLSDDEKFVLFAAKGKTVEKGGAARDMEIRDVASIVLFALDIEQPECYTGRVPSGVFAGVSAGPRPVYNDPDSPRYHITETARNTAEYAKENIKAPLNTYLPFDNGELSGAVAHQTVKFTAEGYFEGAVMLDDGYLTLDSFNPRENSFTLASWVKIPSPHCAEPIFANKVCDGGFFAPEDGSPDGFVFLIVRNTYVPHGIHSARLEVCVMGKPYILEAELPHDYQYGWTHIALVVDRVTGIASIYLDFKKCASALLWGLRRRGANLAPTGAGLAIGQSIDGSHKYKIGLSVDELLIFDGALTEKEMALLEGYYKEGNR